MQRPVPDNTQQTHIHNTGRIRTRNSSKQATANPLLRPHGDWDRLITFLQKQNIEAESTPGHMVLSVATEKIPIDHRELIPRPSD
jgi:hypothetical protein